MLCTCGCECVCVHESVHSPCRLVNMTKCPNIQYAAHLNKFRIKHRPRTVSRKQKIKIVIVRIYLRIHSIRARFVPEWMFISAFRATLTFLSHFILSSCVPLSCSLFACIHLALCTSFWGLTTHRFDVNREPFQLWWHDATTTATPSNINSANKRSERRKNVRLAGMNGWAKRTIFGLIYGRKQIRFFLLLFRSLVPLNCQKEKRRKK